MVFQSGEVDVRRPAWLFRKFRVGLRTEIIFNLALLMTGALLLVGFGIIKIHERDILKQKVKNGKMIVRSLENSLNLHLGGKMGVPERSFLLHRVIQVYTDAGEVEDIAIVDADRRVLASSLEGRRVSRINDDSMAEAISKRQILWRLDRGSSWFFPVYQDLRVFSPLIKDGTPWGGVYLRLSLADVMSSILTSQRLIMLLVLLDGAVIVLFGSFLLSRIIVKPLKALVRGTEGIARGEYDQRIMAGEGNEIGKLADSFNQMTQRLRESQRDVQEYVRSLEAANQQLQQTQMELIRSEKLASIGRFAAGIAHEVGNPLGAILGYTSILQKGVEEPGEASEYLRRVEVEIQRINKIIRELLDFSRPSSVEIREVNLNHVMEDCLSLLSYQKSFKEIDSSLVLKEDLPPVQADESQIQQVFVNLIMNAVDAMTPEGGTLTLQTDDYILQSAWTESNRRPQRRRDDPEDSDYSHLRRTHQTDPLIARFLTGKRVVCARVKDTGCGIQPADLEKIFDPFYTTKDPDRGTGLGLSISMKILENFGGTIDVVSKVGEGSTFSVLLPASKAEWENHGQGKNSRC
jgi:hypothetical protein